MPFAVRPALSSELEELRSVERLAGERFRDVGLDAVADDEPLSVEALSGYADRGRAWVAVDASDRPVGYILVDVVDGVSHIEQLTVRPDVQGNGVGMRLIRAAAQAAGGAGLPPSMTLTTFDRVPWNRPLFEHLGFRVMADSEIGEELREVREREAARGLDPATRVAMRLDLEGLDRLPPPARRFGAVAELYDRARPAYPQALVEDLLAGEPRDVLDVGCGTAKAGRLFVGPGRRVIGVEPDPLMAEVAGRHGVEVEIAEFERWDPRGRTFDLLVSGTAWHWVDPAEGAAKAADVLRSGGRFAAFWNEMIYSEPVRELFTPVYLRHAPDLLRTSYVLGVIGPLDADTDAAAQGLVAAGFKNVVPGTREQYDWSLEYTAADWADLVSTHSDHRSLEPAQLERLRADLVAALEPLEPFTVRCRTDVLGGIRD